MVIFVWTMTILSTLSGLVNLFARDDSKQEHISTKLAAFVALGMAAWGWFLILG